MSALRRFRTLLGDLWYIERNVRLRINLSRFFAFRVPVIGWGISAVIDRSLYSTYGIDVDSSSVDVAMLSIAHPIGVLIGGNGLYSPGRVVIMSGAKLIPKSARDPEYQRKLALRRVFEFGDNVVISSGATLIGPMTICDNVIVGPDSLVNKSITEPGIYMGNPARRVSSEITDEWIAHLPAPQHKDRSS